MTRETLEWLAWLISQQTTLAFRALDEIGHELERFASTSGGTTV